MLCTAILFLSQITSNATSDLNIKVDGRAIVRGNEGVFIMGKTIEFHMGGNMELKAVSNSRIFSLYKWIQLSYIYDCIQVKSDLIWFIYSSIDLKWHIFLKPYKIIAYCYVSQI